MRHRKLHMQSVHTFFPVICTCSTSSCKEAWNLKPCCDFRRRRRNFLTGAVNRGPCLPDDGRPHPLRIASLAAQRIERVWAPWRAKSGVDLLPGGAVVPEVGHPIDGVASSWCAVVDRSHAEVDNLATRRILSIEHRITWVQIAVRHFCPPM